jgi:hypothetical protein
MCRHPPYLEPARHDPGGAGTNPLEKQRFYHFRSVAGAEIGRISMCKTVAQFAAARSSGRIANQGLFCQAKRLPVARDHRYVPRTQRSA